METFETNGKVPKSFEFSLLRELPAMAIKLHDRDVAFSVVDMYRWIAGNQQEPNYWDMFSEQMQMVTGIAKGMFIGGTAVELHNAIIKAGDEYFTAIDEQKKSADSTVSWQQVTQEFPQTFPTGPTNESGDGSKTSPSSMPGEPSIDQNIHLETPPT